MGGGFLLRVSSVRGACRRCRRSPAGGASPSSVRGGVCLCLCSALRVRRAAPREPCRASSAPPRRGQHWLANGTLSQLCFIVGRRAARGFPELLAVNSTVEVVSQLCLVVDTPGGHPSPHDQVAVPPSGCTPLLTLELLQSPPLGLQPPASEPRAGGGSQGPVLLRPH